MEKIYILTRSDSSEDGDDFEIIAASKDLRRLNSVMRDNVEKSGVLPESGNEFLEKDCTDPLDYDNPEQTFVCYTFRYSPNDWEQTAWIITETEVK